MLSFFSQWFIYIKIYLYRWFIYIYLWLWHTVIIPEHYPSFGFNFTFPFPSFLFQKNVYRDISWYSCPQFSLYSAHVYTVKYMSILFYTWPFYTCLTFLILAYTYLYLAINILYMTACHNYFSTYLPILIYLNIV